MLPNMEGILTKNLRLENRKMLPNMEGILTKNLRLENRRGTI